MQKFLILVSLACSLMLASTGNSMAAEVISKQQAATIAKSQFQGRVIAVEEAKQDSTAVYRVKVLDKQGGMHTIIIDHQSGNVISAH
jgi:uncharacterized membrane protein YkoI